MGEELQRAAMICTRKAPECHVICVQGGEAEFPPSAHTLKGRDDLCVESRLAAS